MVRWRLAISSIAAIGVIVGLVALCLGPAPEQTLGTYATSLEGRGEGQRENAVRAAQSLDGVVIGPGEVLSFNEAVGSWSADRGYVKAPVSFSGELVPAWGGGVCQTSTTLYNAALIAGLDVIERHRHTWPPSYVAPGRDAAVAQFEVDLRLRNPYRWPARIRARLHRDSVGFAIRGRRRGPMARVVVETQGNVEPHRVVQGDERLAFGEQRIINAGRPGLQVRVYRRWLKGGRVGRRQLVSHDSYDAMNRIIRVGL